MGYLFKKMLRDLRDNWTQFFSVVLMATISVLIFSGMASVWTGLNSAVDDYVKETNMADSWVRAAGIGPEDLEALKDLKAVKDLSLSMQMTAPVEADKSELCLNAFNDQVVSHPLTISGDPYDPAADEGIWLDRDYARKHRIKSGDMIKLKGAKESLDVKVRGIVMSPEYIYYTGNITETIPNYDKYGYAFISRRDMQKLFPGLPYTMAHIRTTGSISDEKLEDIFGKRFIAAQDRDSFMPFARVGQESRQMQKMASLFSLVFILLALMTMYTSMVRLVNRQKMTIGTLKALGTSARKIRLHYAGYGLVLPIIGGLAGLLLGRITVSKALMKVKQTTIYLPEWRLIHSEASLVLIGIIVLSCVFASVWAAGQCLKDMPAETMRNTGGKSYRQKEGKEDGFLGKVSYEWRWVLRNISQNKVRFLMGIVGVFGGMVLIIAGLGVQDAIHSSNDFVFDQCYQYENKVLLNRPGDTVGLDGTANHQWLQEGNIEIKYGDGQVKQSVLTVCDNGDMVRFYDDENKKFDLPKEGAVISRKLGRDLGIAPGNTVEVRIFGLQDWIKLTVDATSKTLSPQGLFMSRRAYENLDRDFLATTLLTAEKDSSIFSNNPKVKSVISKKQQIKNTDKVANSVMSIVKLLIAASILLSIVILYNLGILNYVERVRDFATMKVLGFLQKEIRQISIRECLLSTAIGWLIGLPAGVAFLKLYIKIISFDSFEWVAMVRPATLIIASVVIIGASLSVNLILSNKVKKIKMVESLKSVE